MSSCFKVLIVSTALFLSPFIQAKEAVTEISMFSKVLGEDRVVSVKVPKSYDKNKNEYYPVLYRLDGAGNIPLESAILEELHLKGAAPEVIIVAIENTDRLRDLAPYVNQDPRGPVGAGGGADKFLSFLSTELMPHIKEQYRVTDFKVISGASIAGLFALHTLRVQPDLFDAYIAYSPAVWWGENKTAKLLPKFVSSTKELDTYLYMNMGSEHISMSQVYNDMLANMQTRLPNKFKLHTDAFPTVPHALTSKAGLFNAYHNSSPPLIMPNSELKNGVSSIKNYYQNVSEQRGKTTIAQEWVMRELGYYLMGKQDFDTAIEVFKYNIELYPESAEAYNGLAYAYEENKQYEDSLAQVTISLQLAKEGDSGYQYFIDRKKRLDEKLGVND